MRSFIIITIQLVFICVVTIGIETKSIKKQFFNTDNGIYGHQSSKKSIPSLGKFYKMNPPASPPIIAIEIVDPHENDTDSSNGKSRNSKRTINSHLGYGYQPNLNGYYLGSGKPPPPPTFQVYKYSQHDIPPYRSRPPISTDFKPPPPPRFNYQPVLNQYYQPGTTLFTTIGQHGELTKLMPNLPYNQPEIPVLVLRVFPSQLTDPNAVLHPHLPQNHPLAATLNNIDLNALLVKYIQSSLESPPQPPQYYHYQHSSHQLLTHENHPKDTHTQVILRGPNGRGSNDYSLPVALPKRQPPPPITQTFKIHLPPAISGVHIQSVDEPVVPAPPSGPIMYEQQHYRYTHLHYPEESAGGEVSVNDDPQSVAYFYMSSQTPDKSSQYSEATAEEENSSASLPYNSHGEDPDEQRTRLQPPSASQNKYFNYHAHQRRRIPQVELMAKTHSHQQSEVDDYYQDDKEQIH